MTLSKLKLVIIAALTLSLSFIVVAKEINERQASKLAQKKYSAEKLLKVETIMLRGQKLYKVKLLVSNGRLKTVYVDSKTGSVSAKKP